MVEEDDLILLNNVKKLRVGSVIHNYLFMCDLLGENIKVGNSRKCQINNWKRFFEWEANGHKYKIIKVYDIPLDRVIQRGGNNKKYYVQYCVNQIYNNYVGVYSIEKDNQIYIGSTTVGFRHRFLQHISRDTKTTELLLDGGTFQIVWSLKEGNEPEIRSKENYYINLYKNDSGYILINTMLDLFKNMDRKVYETIKILKKDKNRIIKLLESEKIHYKIQTRKKRNAK